MTNIESTPWPAESIVLQSCSLKVKRFKCFKDSPASPQGLHQIKPVNIIVGRNNSGKSAFLESILFAFKVEKKAEEFGGELILAWSPAEEDIANLPSTLEEVRVDNRTESFTPSRYGKNLVGKKIEFALFGNEARFLGPIEGDDPMHIQKIRFIGNSLVRRAVESLKNWIVLSLKSERDVLPEANAPSQTLLGSNGAGLTRLFQALMYRAESNRLDLIENVVVPALNEILMPDNRYERIVMRENGGLWEIFLEEKSKGHVPLSSTGSGVKTVLLVLANLLILPELYTTTKRHRFIFAFEELENNLHPATLRRLFQYISRYSEEHKCHFFITTHSHLVIDMFSAKTNAQVLHVTHDGLATSIRTIKSRIEGVNVLNDLDIRASDLLQTNVVIWVEGPTDAMYIERWIDLHSDGKLRRGIDYQCVCYGGSVGSHLTFDADTAAKLVQAIKICRHAIFVVDSNRSEKDSKLDKDAERVFSEVSKVGGFGWITDGREIENYLPAELISSEAKAKLVGTTKYTDFYEAIREARGTKGQMRKTALANRIVPKLTLDNIYRDDLEYQLTEVCKLIGIWNQKTN